MGRAPSLFEIPDHRLEMARTLALEIRDKLRHGRPSKTGQITVNMHPSAQYTMDDILTIIEDRIDR